jgi:hypothetical protein
MLLLEVKDSEVERGQFKTFLQGRSKIICVLNSPTRLWVYVSITTQELIQQIINSVLF